MSSEYDYVARGKLKLKKPTQQLKEKKKKKKNKDKETKIIEQVQEEVLQLKEGSGPKLTKAEMSFKKMQEKIQNQRILEMASMTHKQRVEKFNEHLDSLTEHFDIPKVSWTK